MGATKKATHPAAIDEVTPLLAASSEGPTAQANEETLRINKINGSANDNGHVLEGNADEDEDKPLPKGQIFILCLARMVDPMSFFCIFPFVNQMIKDNGGIDEKDVGFYSGLIVCSGFYICDR